MACAKVSGVPIPRPHRDPDFPWIPQCCHCRLSDFNTSSPYTFSFNSYRLHAFTQATPENCAVPANTVLLFGISRCLNRRMVIIPLEIQLLAIEWVYRLSQHLETDYDTLLACALVCRTWRPIAQRLLFRRVPRQPRSQKRFDGSPLGFKLLVDTLRACPHLAAHVRSIYLTLDSPDAVDAALLEVCPHIAGVETALDSHFLYYKPQIANPERVQSIVLSVFYKFKSRVTFDGTGIPVFDLKKEIILANNLGKAN
ncbi:hypothetical protein FA95DRAFT_503791 [Auriscalpium vulgare]|uniref:Uncharacterized protein n=1 Tax=Auriscalpium vulgare TaxID=40419 RepID=A0ACB8RGI8_9AGAM|nr:hypothetical protein FA95DRAFT_503791 [Auriscalpium vulgare]